MQFINIIKRRAEEDDGKRAIILDTSALCTQRAMQIIEESSKVYLLTGTILEMDRLKHEKGIFGNNIRAISRKSREDSKSEKYICIAGYDKEDYQDHNIIEYCKKNKKVTLLTADNNLCNLAKAYNITYIFVEVEENTEENNKNTCEVKITDNSANITFYKNFIKYDKRENFYTCIKLERDSKLIELGEYQEGDILYAIKCSKRGKYMEVERYEIIKKYNNFEARILDTYQIKLMNEIFIPKLPEEITEEIVKSFKHYLC